MELYDCVVVGAGPAGGQCARRLAKEGKRVLLVEKAKDFAQNNFSTAGSLMEVVEEFSLPMSCVGSKWSRVKIISTNEEVDWTVEKEGVVFDFQALREFLADEVTKGGSEVLLGWAYHHHDGLNLHLKQQGGKGEKSVQAKVIIDATGAERGVLNKRFDKDRAMGATGIEFLLEVSDADYGRWKEQLSFFIGTKWMPQGYGWIFPMEKNRLKLGIGRYYIKENVVPHRDSYTYYLEQLIGGCLKDPHTLVDRHGKTLYYSYGRKDPHLEGNVIAIGDAISMVNPFALEGIRHAMWSGQIGAEHVLKYLDKNEPTFWGYKKAIGKYTFIRWPLSELMMHKLYREKRDVLLDRVVSAFKELSGKEMINLCFHYRIREAIKFLAYLFKYQLLGAKSKGSK